MKTSKKSFIRQTSELKGRLDPFYYQDIFTDVHKKLDKINCVSLFKVSKKILDGIHKTPKYSEQGLKFLQANNIKEGAIDFQNKIKYIDETWVDEVLARYTPRAGDILVTKDGTIGVAATVPSSFESFSIFVSVLAIRPKQELINSEFLRIMISSYLVQQQILQSTKGAVISHLLIGEAKKLKIPLPSKEVQNHVVDIMDNAYKIKQENESRAKALLDSIDTYLLDKLDISLPKEEKVVSFEVDSSEVFGNRIDPEHKIKMNNLENLKGHYPFIALKHLMVGSAQYGANETAKEALLETNVRYIRITDIDDMGRLKSAKIKTADTISEQYILNYDDILFARSGSVGRCYIHKEVEKKAIFAGYLIRFRLDKSKVNPDYLFFFCHSSIYKYWVSAIERPTVQSNINSQEYKALKIPLPPLETQKEIASHIQALREEAKQLQQEAKEVLASAKDEVEAIILH